MGETRNLSHYLAAWELAHPRLLTQTRTSHVYTVTHGGEAVILKILSPSETEERRGALALLYFDGDGAVRLLRHDDGTPLMEYAAGDPLVFDPKGLVGERTYDCANALCNPGRPELVHDETRLLTHAALLADLLALDRWPVLAFTYAWACLNTNRWLLGGTDIVRWYLKVAEIVEPHVSLRAT
jgi:streptomycin 6-kinase